MSTLDFDFAVHMEDLTISLKSLTILMKKVGGSAKEMGVASNHAAKNIGLLGDKSSEASNNLKKLNKNADETNNGLSNLSKTSKSFSWGKLFNVAITGTIFGKFINSVMAVEETVNLFNVSMGMAAEETEVALRKISDATGLDHTMLQQVTGNYTLLARSMGLTAQNAATLGRSTTKLGLDLSSLMNVPIDKVMDDLRSGLLGQTETVYKYGIDLTEASLEQERLRLGINKSVRSMSQAEKMQLRYSVMIRQTSLAHGDFAKTIESPANQIRVLASQITGLGRAIGSVFIGTFGKALPYINGFVMAIRTVVEALATLVGYKPPKVENIAGGFDNVGGAVDDANDSVTNLKKNINSITLPFDELHSFQDQATPSTPSVGTGGMGKPIDWGLEEYNNQLEKIKMKAVEIKENILKWLGFTQEVNEETGKIEWTMPDFKDTKSNLEEILKWIGYGTTLFAGWKLGSALFDSFKKLKDNILDIGEGKSGSFKWLAGVWGAAVLSMLLDTAKLYNENDKFKAGADGLKGIGDSILDLFKEIGLQILDALPDNVKQFISDVASEIKKLGEELSWDKFDTIALIAGFLMLFNPLLAPIGLFILAVKGLQIALTLLGMDGGKALNDIKEGIDEVTEGVKKGSKVAMGIGLSILGAVIATIAVIAAIVGAITLGWVLLGVGIALLIVGIIVALWEPLKWLWENIKIGWENTILFMQTASENFKIWWNILCENIQIAFKNTWYIIENVVKSVWNGIINTVQAGVNSIIKLINLLLKQINKILPKPIKLIDEINLKSAKLEYKKLLEYIKVPDGSYKKANYTSFTSLKDYFTNNALNGDKGAASDYKLLTGKELFAGPKKPEDNKKGWLNGLLKKVDIPKGEIVIPTTEDITTKPPSTINTDAVDKANLTNELNQILDIMKQEAGKSDTTNSGTINNIINLDGKTIYKNQQQIQKSRGIDFGTPAFMR